MKGDGTRRTATEDGALLNKWHIFIDTSCANYPSTPDKEILDNLKKQKRGFHRHKNSGSTTIDMARDLGNIKQV